MSLNLGPVTIHQKSVSTRGEKLRALTHDMVTGAMLLGSYNVLVICFQIKVKGILVHFHHLYSPSNKVTRKYWQESIHMSFQQGDKKVSPHDNHLIGQVLGKSIPGIFFANCMGRRQWTRTSPIIHNLYSYDYDLGESHITITFDNASLHVPHFLYPNHWLAKSNGPHHMNDHMPYLIPFHFSPYHSFHFSTFF